MAARAAKVSLEPDTSLQGRVVYAKGIHTPIYRYLGVPYAQPPVGRLRFQPPEPVELWRGTRQATQFGAIPPQRVPSKERGNSRHKVPENMDEDCLFVNIWTRTPPSSTTRLPVFVYLYGGMYISGFSDKYDGTALAAMQDVVFVSLNYRLGLFGFLCTGDGYVPGNMGLLDQLEAFRWVQRYIHLFGGDANNVTLCGESAGGMSATMHLLSPLAEGLFHKVIIASGTCVTPTVGAWPLADIRRFLLKRLKQIGCRETRGEDIVRFLNTKSSAQLLKDFYYAFPRALDGRYILGVPDELYAAGRQNAVPMLIGMTSDDCYDFARDFARADTVASRAVAEKIVQSLFRRQFFRGHPHGGQLVEAVCREYLDPCGEDTRQLTKALSDMYADFSLTSCIHAIARSHSGKVPTYMYLMHHRPFSSKKPDWVVMDHGEDVAYVLGEPFLSRCPDDWPEEEKELCRSIMTYWCNFARTGDPNVGGHPSSVKWPRFDQESEKYMMLQMQPSVASHLRSERVDFWVRRVPEILGLQIRAKY